MINFGAGKTDYAAYACDVQAIYGTLGVGSSHINYDLTDAFYISNNDAEHKLRQIMSQPLLSGDIRSQMTAYIALPDPDMLLQFRLRRAEGGDEVDLRDVVKQYMEKLHPRVKARLEQE